LPVELQLTISSYETYATACIPAETLPADIQNGQVCGYGKDPLSAVRDLRGRLAQEYGLSSVHFVEIGDEARESFPPRFQHPGIHIP
jgi:hypothetical protein